jgi:zinc D-Ala-D-Ala dipeptidase
MSHDVVIRSSLSGMACILVACAGFVLVFFHAALAGEAKHVEKSLALLLEAPEVSSGISPLEQRLIQKGFINVRTLDQTIMVDLKYARTDNFMGTNVYGDFTQAYLRPEAARMLAKASEILRERHPELRILVADALRPRSIQHKMWKQVVDTEMQPYVANPHTGSMHNHGGAVDVTLYCVQAGELLDMGTPLDYFGPLAQPRLEAKFLKKGKLSEQQIKNRRILRSAMVEAGWRVLQIEWWHFDAFPIDYIRRNYSIVE